MQDRILCVSVTPCLQRTLEFARVQIGEVNRAMTVTVSLGGKSQNVARALKALGDHPLVVGFAGGETGRAMASFLIELGIDSDLVQTAEPTRVCTSVVDQSRGYVTELVEEAPCPRTGEWKALERKLARLLPRCRVVVASGALPPASPNDVYARLAAMASASGAALLVDARGEALTACLGHAPTLAKLNRKELAETCGRSVETRSDLQDCARSLLARGAQWALITDGPQSAWLWHGKSVWELVPPAVDVLNPIGSGDAVSAAIASALNAGWSMPEAVRRGIACGAANATTLTPGDVDAGLVAQLSEQVVVHEHRADAGAA